MRSATEEGQCATPQSVLARVAGLERRTARRDLASERAEPTLSEVFALFLARLRPRVDSHLATTT